jgi:hypothetical protein
MAINYELKKLVTTWCVDDVQSVRADLTDEKGARRVKDKEDSTTTDWHDLTPKQQSELETLLEEWLDREEEEQDE